MKSSLKYLAVYRNKEKYTITAMCRFFSVSRSGYYEYLKRMDVDDKDEALGIKIAQCQLKSIKTYGYRRVKIWLEREGFVVNHKKVLRIMNKYGLLSEIRRRRKYKYMGQQLHKYENILNRQFYANKPNQKWVTDISYIHTGQGVLYLSMIRDLFDNSIVAYQTGTEQTVKLVSNTINKAIAQEKITTELQLHSDQGFQYTSREYFKLTKEYNITPSMSRRGNCYDNAMAENFFGILKAECIYRNKLNSFEQARRLIDDYIFFYNFERIQLKTKLTPYEKRSQAV